MTTSAGPAPPPLAIVIPVRNDAIRLRQCLASIHAAAGNTPVEVVVADNGSGDDTPAVAVAQGASVVSAPRRAVAAVRNAGVAATTAPLIAFVDADHELHPQWIEAALAAMADDLVAAAGSDYHPPLSSTWVQRMYDRLRRHPSAAEPTDWLPSGNLVVRRDIFAAVGGFDETLESCEDVDLSRRIREAGGRLVADPALRSTHHGDPGTLRAVFFSELWRGRDNVRVTLRERQGLRSLTGLGFTMLYLAALMAVIVGALFWAAGGAGVAIAGAGVLAVLTATRVAHLMRAGGRPIEAIPFAATFDTARALALVVRVGHCTRRKA